MTSQPMDPAELLSGVPAIAAFLGIPPDEARRLCDDGTIPSFLVGDLLCARRSTLRAWLAREEAISLDGAAPDVNAVDMSDLGADRELLRLVHGELLGRFTLSVEARDGEWTVRVEDHDAGTVAVGKAATFTQAWHRQEPIWEGS